MALFLVSMSCPEQNRGERLSAVGSDQTKSLKLARNLKKYGWKKALEGHFWPRKELYKSSWEIS